MNTYARDNICGFCNYSAKYHFETREAYDSYPDYTDVCGRTRYEVGSMDLRPVGYDTPASQQEDTDAYGRPLSFDGVGYDPTIESDNTDPWYIEYDSSTATIESYRDLDSSEHTVTLEEYRQGTNPRFSEPARNAYVEGQDGFLILNILDENLTKKFHFHLLNFFKNKYTGKFQVGGIAFTKNTDGSISGSCTHDDCKKLRRSNRAGHTLTINLSNVIASVQAPYSLESEVRKAQEEFIYACIRHGNNHAASWFTSRDTFYKLHTQDCDLTCDPKSAYCVSSLVQA